jgi:tetratricopeptide (TPR) repeat protein
LIAYNLAFIRGDQSTMQHAVDSVAGTGDEAFLLELVAGGKYFAGRVQQGREVSNAAVQKAEQYKEFAAGVRLSEAGAEAEFGNIEEARRQTQAALALTDDTLTQSQAALTLARIGDTGRAEKLIAELAKQNPANAVLNQGTLALARAGVELERKQPAQAVAALERRNFSNWEGARPLRSTSGLFTCAGRPILTYTIRPMRSPSIRGSPTIAGSLRRARCTYWLASERRAPTPSRGIAPKPGPRIRIFLSFGRMPTPMCRC